MSDSLVFTVLIPTWKATTKTVPLRDVEEPGDNYNTIYEVDPGYGLTAKDLGPGQPDPYVFTIDIEAATYDALLIEMAAWRYLRHAQGTVVYTLSDHGPETVTKLRLQDIQVTQVNPLNAEAILKMVQVQ